MEIHDAMPLILWSLYFVQSKGYSMSHAFVYQDNQSITILKTKNKVSNSKRTKHIKMWYFFVKTEDIQLEY